MENITLLRNLIEQTPGSHALKIALLDAYLKEGMMAEFETALFLFLSQVPSSDPSHDQLKSYLEKRAGAEKTPEVNNPTLPDAFEDSAETPPDFFPGEENPETDEPEIPAVLTDEKIGFDQVGGMEGVKQKIRQLIINPFKNEDLYRVYKKRIGGGLLLYGPPGCGKTHLAKAISHEVDAHFLEVSLHDILDMWMGSSEKSLHDTFEKARRNTPCVLFFDEVDALSYERSKIQHNSDNKIITQFLKEFDGLSSNNDKILTIGATNLPWNIDSAFRRPGRFDRVIFCPPPDLEAREKIFEIHLKEKPADANLDFKRLAKLTRDYSGADIMFVVHEVADECFDEAMEKDSIVNISQKRLERAIKQVKPSTKEWFSTAQRYLDYANVDGVYDEITEYIKNRT